jgi:dipeptidyl aminopeptidase/acylaminoacyl peptidase
MNKRDVILTVDGLKISGELFIPGDKPPYPTVCLCHGVPSGITEPDDGGYPALAERISKEGFTTFFFNFRGSRNSEGNFDISGWLRDLNAVIDYLWQQPEVDRNQLALVGNSAGAAVSVCTAAKDKRIAAVATMACPAELSFISKDPAPTIKYFRDIGIIRDPSFPPSIEKWLEGFKEAAAIRDIAGIAPRPLLIVHGVEDDVVKVSDARELFQVAGEPKMLVLIEGAGHRLRREERAVQAVIDWLKDKFKSK